jgi:hypothetical protein
MEKRKKGKANAKTLAEPVAPKRRREMK